MADNKPNHRAAERKAAADRNYSYYFTGRPCLRGHVSDRVTSTGYCVECRRDRDRKWYADNPEKSSLKAKKYYAADPEGCRRRSREWRARSGSKEKAKATRQQYEQMMGDVIAEKNRRNAANYRQRFPEKAKLAINNWWEKNPGRKKAYHHNRRARKRGNGGTHTAADILDILKNQRGKCIYCPARLYDKYHVDHIVPLFRGGRNDRRNLQILCEPCNLSKGSKDPIEFSQQRGLLL